MNTKMIAGLVAGLVAFFGAKYGVRYLLTDKSTNPPAEVPAEISSSPAYKTIMGELDQVKDELKESGSIEEALKISEEALQGTLPLTIDEVTTMTAAKAGPGKKFTYDYVLDGEGISEMTGEQIESFMRPTLEKQYDGPAMAAFKKGKVTAIYRYFNAQGEVICKIVIDPRP